jgi:hypothetical protein
LLVGREGLENNKIGNNKIGGGEIEGGEIEGGEEGVGIADCEEFFLNYIDRCAVSLHFANLVIDRVRSRLRVRTDFKFIEFVRDRPSIIIFEGR